MPSLTVPPKSAHSASQGFFNHFPIQDQYISVLSSANISRALQEAKQSWWKEQSSSIFYALKAQYHLLESMYSFRDKGKVLRFLEAEQEIVLLLLEAKFTIAKFFPGSEVFLEVDTDPEAPTNKQLVAFIATSLPSNEALSRLRQFDEDWWLNTLDRAQRKLCINVEFQ